MKKHPQVSGRFRNTSTQILITTAAACAAFSLELPCAHAADVSWNAVSGLYNTGANWLGGSVPLATDNALISNGGTATVQTGDTVTVTNVLVNGGSTLTQTGGSFGASGTGADPATAYQIGGVSGQTGTYNVSGASTLTGGRVRIGETGGTGTMTLANTSTYTGDGGRDTWLGNGVGSVGSLTLSDSAHYNITNDALVVGRSGGTGTFTMTGSSALTGTGNDIYFGDGGGTTSTTTISNAATITWNGGGTLRFGNNGATSTTTIQDTASITDSAGQIFVGQSGGSNGTLNIKGHATVSNGNWVAVGRDGGTGTLTISENGTLTKTGGGDFIIASDGDNSTGTVNLKDSGTLNVNSVLRIGSDGVNHHGFMTVQNNATLNAGGEIWVGNGGNNATTAGTLTIQDSATVTASSWIAVGRSSATGTLNMSGGTLTHNATGAVNGTGGFGAGSNFTTAGIGTNAQAIINHTGGTINNPNSVTVVGETGTSNWNASGGTANLGPVYIGFTPGSNGTLAISGTANYTAGNVFLGSNGATATPAGGTGALNLTGGTLTANHIEKGAGTGTLSFNGGVLKAGADDTDFIKNFGSTSTTLGAGGLNLDSNTHAVAINSVLSGAGGLTKQGAGTLTLGVANTYTGVTAVTGGTLKLGITGAINSASNLSLNSGTLALNGFSDGVGTLTLLSSSTIDFGAAGANTAAFANSGAITWTGTLSLANFEVGTDTLSFGTNATGLTSGQLAQLSLPGYHATGLNASGVVQFAAVPEPMDVGLAIGGAMMLLAFKRSRARRQTA